MTIDNRLPESTLCPSISLSFTIISQKIFAHQVQYTVPSVYHHAAPLHYAYAHPYVMPVAAEHKMVEEA